MALDRLSQRILVRPPKIVNPIGNSIAVNAETAAPVRNGVSLAINRDLSDSDLVVVLLNPRRPLAVARLVVAIAVDSLNRVLGRGPSAHVGNEIGKGIEPAVANVDSSASVARVRTQAATLTHGSPDSPFRRVYHAMLRMQRTGLVSLKASAALGVSAVQLVGRYVQLLSALAAASPFTYMATAGCRTLNGSQASKLHSGQINFGWHRLTV